MTELSFAKSFLATLESRPQRLQADYVQDPKKLPARTPYILPITQPPKTKRQKTEGAGADATVNLIIKPLRPNPAVQPVTLSSIALSTPVLSLKAQYSTSTNTPVEKLKLLLKGKPLTDTKTLSDLGLKANEDAVITVMVMGGASTPAAASPSPGSPAPEEKVKVKVLEGDAFWGDLKSFLVERLGKEEIEEDPEVVLETFRKAWQKA